MNKFVALAVSSLFVANLAFAQAAAPATPASPAAAAPGSCAEKAVGKNGKPLAGAAKSAFMKKCEKDNPAPATADGKTTQQNKMATCNAEATGKKGDDRKAFMKACLSK